MSKTKKLAKHLSKGRPQTEHPAHFTEYYLDQLIRGKLPHTRDFLFNARFLFSVKQRPNKEGRSSLHVALRQNGLSAHVEYDHGLTQTEAMMLVQSMVGVTALTYAALGFQVPLPTHASEGTDHTVSKHTEQQKGKKEKA